MGKRRAHRPHVALIVDTDLASGRNILLGIVRFAHDYGSWLVYHEPRSIEDPLPSWVRRWKGDGIIARLQDKRMASGIARTGIPAVDVLGVARVPGIPLVHVDNAAVARMAADHLLDRGFRSFGFCNMKGTNWSEERLKAFVRRVRQRKCRCDVYHMASSVYIKWSWETEQDRLVEWLKGLPRPAGVMICSDWKGKAVTEACARAGIRVPEEVAVVGVDNDTTLCEVCDPPLTSVAPDYERIGFEAATRLEKMMAGKRVGAKPVLIGPRTIQVRRSTDVLAVEEAPVAKAIRTIRENACRGIRADDVVKQVPMSRSVLQRRFREVLGRSIHDELMAVRLAEARYLLSETDEPLSVIAEEAGFRHQEYMGAVFRKMTGMTPLQYRRQWR